MFREDNSLDSANNPVKGNQYYERDYGFYKAIVRDVIYSDNEANSTKSETPRVLYTVQILGGERDGQLFQHAEDMTQFGGVSNYSERIWKGTTTLLQADLANLYTNFENLPQLNGDVVYIQFMNGDTNFPVILGGAKHASNKKPTATAEDGPVFKERFNGITTAITKDGEWSWTKANGAYTAVPLPDVEGNLPIVQDQFAILPTFEEAIKINIGNNFDILFKLNVTPGQGMAIAIDGMADTFSLTTLSGAALAIDGVADKFSYTTLTGIALTLDGLGDKFTVTSTTGAALSLDGLGDKIDLTTTAGSSLSVSGVDGITAQDAAGDKLFLGNGAAEFTNASGAFLKFDAAGFIKFGNAGADVLKDVLQELIKALTTEAPSGFGAPLTNVATYVQLLTKIMLVTGG